MKQIMCVRLKSWPIDRLRRKHPEYRHKPLVLIETIASRQLVTAACDEAAKYGIRSGMTLAQARALHADLAHADDEPHRDAQALEALARWMMRFSPVVSINFPDAIFLDVTGCERVFRRICLPLAGEGRGEGDLSIAQGRALTLTLSRNTGRGNKYTGLYNLVQFASHALAKMRVSVAVAIAPTPGAAWAWASFGNEHPKILSCEEVDAALGPLQPAALRIDATADEMLHHLGIETIDQLLKLPRDLLPARFGAQLLQRIDQAFGRLAEPLVPLDHHLPVRAGMDFDGAVDSLEAIWMVFKQLIGQVIAQLIRRGCGARRMEVEFLRAYAPTIRKTIHLSRPSRDPANLFNLLRCAMETVESEDGFIGMKLAVPAIERLSEEQLHIHAREEQVAETELAHLIELLSVRLGERAVAQAELVESHLPERAWRSSSGRALVPSPTYSGDRVRVRGRVKKAVEKQWNVSNENSFRSDSTILKLIPSPLPSPLITGERGDALRPLHLFDQPIEIRVMAGPSEAGDGPPISFTHQRTVHRIRHTRGPERISGIWWEGHHKTRDYFEVETEESRRFWVFRVRESNRWFWQGEFG